MNYVGTPSGKPFPRHSYTSLDGHKSRTPRRLKPILQKNTAAAPIKNFSGSLCEAFISLLIQLRALEKKKKKKTDVDFLKTV